LFRNTKRQSRRVWRFFTALPAGNDVARFFLPRFFLPGCFPATASRINAPPAYDAPRNTLMIKSTPVKRRLPVV